MQKYTFFNYWDKNVFINKNTRFIVLYTQLINQSHSIY